MWNSTQPKWIKSIVSEIVFHFTGNEKRDRIVFQSLFTSKPKSTDIVKYWQFNWLCWSAKMNWTFSVQFFVYTKQWPKIFISSRSRPIASLLGPIWHSLDFSNICATCPHPMGTLFLLRKNWFVTHCSDRTMTIWWLKQCTFSTRVVEISSEFWEQDFIFDLCQNEGKRMYIQKAFQRIFLPT